MVLDAPFEVLEETATTAKIDGHWGLGQVVSTRAMNMAIAMPATIRALRFAGEELTGLCRLSPNKVNKV